MKFFLILFVFTVSTASYATTWNTSNPFELSVESKKIPVNTNCKAANKKTSSGKSNFDGTCVFENPWVSVSGRQLNLAQDNDNDTAKGFCNLFGRKSIYTSAIHNPPESIGAPHSCLGPCGIALHLTSEGYFNGSGFFPMLYTAVVCQ